MTKKLAVLFPFVLGLVIWISPHPAGVTENAWHLLAIFVFTITGIILKTLTMGGMALLSLALITLTKTLTLKEALTGFGSPIVWLVVLAFFIAKSFVKTGLGFRIAYMLVSLLGKKSLGLAYGMALTDLVLAPAIPSNTARGGGIIFPIIKSLALTFESSPEKKTERRIGSFLILTAYHVNIITSAMFLTAMAANPMMVDLADKMGVKITWGTWCLAALVPGLLSLLVIPWVLYKLYPPRYKETPEAPEMARQHLKAMGKMTQNEWITLSIFLLMLVLWVFGGILQIDSTVTALVGVSILVISGVLEWKDITHEHAAWDTFFWFATLIMIAAYLNELGLIKWIGNSIEEGVSSIHWVMSYALLVVGYFYTHYLFASNTAHISSLFAAFSVVGITAGIPPMMLILSLAFISNLSACVTHYGTGHGPIFFGSGYVDLKTWWKLGAIISVIHLFIWIGLGSLWWKAIGLW